MNNFHYNNNLYELIEILLEEQFGKEVSTLGISLLSNGPTSIQELMKILSWSFLDVRDCLIILMQNKLIFYQETTRKEFMEIIYELDVEGVLNYIRFPKILYFINNRYDQNALLIFEEFMQFGILSANQVIEQINDKLEKNGRVNPSTSNNLKARLIQLIENGFIVQSKKKLAPELKEEKNKKEKVDKKLISNKKKKTYSLELNNQEEIKKDVKVSMASKVVEDDNPIIYNREKNKYYLFSLNFDKIISELKVEIVVDMINQQIDGHAGMITSIMLKKNSGLAFTEGKSIPITLDDIMKQMNITQTKDKKVLTERQESVKKLLEEMSKEENDIIIPWGVSETGQAYCLNLENIGNILKTKTLEKIIEQQFSTDHIRIYRLLSKCGPLDAKNIMDICLMPQKECSSCLNQMIQEGLIETQHVNYKGSNIIFYNINTQTNYDLMIAKIYKIIKNLKYFLKNEIEKIKNTESQLRQEQYITKVYNSISELDNTIIVLKYF